MGCEIPMDKKVVHMNLGFVACYEYLPNNDMIVHIDEINDRSRGKLDFVFEW